MMIGEFGGGVLWVLDLIRMDRMDTNGSNGRVCWIVGCGLVTWRAAY